MNTGMLEASGTLSEIALDKNKNPVISQLALDSLGDFATKYKDSRSKQLLTRIPVTRRTKIEIQNKVVATPQ